MRKAHDIHVSADLGPIRWKVMRHGKTLSFHRTQATAVKIAIRHAKRHRADVLTHGLDGRIRSKDSYANETPIRDTER